MRRRNHRYALMLITSLMFTMLSHAATTTSIRTLQGDIVSVGDSKNDLFKKMGKASAESGARWHDNGKSCAVKHYHYDIEQQSYDVMVCRNQIVQINWFNH